MMTVLSLPALLASTLFCVLVVVHLFSTDAGRRERARRLLRAVFRV
jgi:RNase P protein component